MKKFTLITAAILLAIGGNANPVLFPAVDSGLEWVIGVASAANCPTGYSQPANQNWTSCYKVYDNYKTRKDAVAQCHRDNGTLASVPNGFVNSYLYSLATNTVPASTSLWLGTQCFNGDSKSCINDDSTSFTYNNFYTAQPTAQDICIYMSTIGRDSQKWSTFDCEQNFQFACEVTVGKKHQNLVCPQGYTAFQGMCYSTIYDTTGGRTYDESVTQCRKQPGGNLATINSAEVQTFINNNATSQCVGNYYVRMGLRCLNIAKDGDTSSCKWDDGTPFSYNAFRSGDPEYGPANDCTAFDPRIVGQNWLSRECSLGFHCYTCQSTGI